MTREEIAKKNVKAYEGLGRTIMSQQAFFDVGVYKEGTILTLKETKSFAGQNARAEYQPETSMDGKLIQIVFNCDGKVLSHKVDYNNEEEVEELSAVEGEDEYLVPAGTHFVVNDCSNEDDIKEMGYCEVNIEQLSDEDYKEMIADGVSENNDI